MKNKILKIFIVLFVVVCSPAFGFVVGGGSKCDTSKSNISACQNKFEKDICNMPGSSEGHCDSLDGCLKCVVYECKPNYLLVMKNGKSMGYCTSKASAEKSCSSKGCKVKYAPPPRKPDVKDGAWDGCVCDENDESVAENKECVKPEHALSVSGTQPNCNVDQCESGWVPSDDKKSCIENKEQPVIEGESEKTESGDAAVASADESHADTGAEDYDATRTEYAGASSKSFGKQDSKPKERTDAEKAAALESKRSAYDDAYKNEQSDANKGLTALTTAATGIGAMELARGLAEQRADAAADRNMSAYMQTFRCSYADGKSVKGGVEEIELPGGNDEKIMGYRNEYFALASSLKERKESLNMKPGIESDVILDKANAGLYDDENVGITGGQYSSLYRAKMGSEADATMIAQDKDASANRVKYGAIALGAGAAVGFIGNSLINGKLGEKIKEAKADKDSKKKEASAMKDLKQCLKDAGTTNYDKLKFDKFTPSVLNLDNIDCKNDLTDIKGKDATTLLTDSDDAAIVSEKLTESFGEKNASLMLRDSDFGQGLKYCGNSVEGNHFPVRTSSATPWNKCDGLNKGEWRVEFADDKYLEGISVCSYSAGENIESVFVGNSVPDSDLQAKIQKDYDNWVSDGKPDFSKPEGSPSKIGCYCKTSDGTKWVYNYASTFSGCKTNCAWDCGYQQTTTKQVGNVDFTNTLVTGVHTVYQ